MLCMVYLILSIVLPLIIDYYHCYHYYILSVALNHKISLNNTWSFQQSIESMIKLTLFGDTTNPLIDTDLLLVLSVNNWQYFSFFIHLDETVNIKSRIYSSLSLSNITRSVSEWISDNTIHSRWDRISNNDQWMSPSSWNQQAIWPLTFVTINNPINNQIIFQFFHNNSSQYVFQHIFDSTFISNTPIDVYVMGDSNHEQFVVSSINIQSIYNNTAPPTSIPTFMPTYSPTIVPSNNPTIGPTFMPTILPSNNPSQLPTDYPTQIPTINPTFSPTMSTILLTIHYRIVVTITFAYELSINDTDLIMNRLGIYFQNKTCINTTTIHSKHIDLLTLINITMFTCQNHTQLSDILHVSNNTNLIQNINQQTELQIDENKTSIEILITDANHIIRLNNSLPQTTDYIVVVRKSEPKALIWIIKLIALQLIICCLLSCCVFCIKFRTKRLQLKQAEISNAVIEMKRNSNNSSSITSSENDSELQLNQRRIFHKHSAETTDEKILEYGGNISIMKLLKMGAQKLDTVTEEKSDVMSQKKPLKYKYRTQIISQSQTESTFIPSIPNGEADTPNNSVVTSTQIDMLDADSVGSVNSPTWTFTYTCPKNNKWKAKRGLV